MENRSPCEWLDFREITLPLRELAGEYAELTGEWTCTPVRGGYGDNLGVWRIAGLRSSPNGDRPWSMVLKGSVTRENSGDPSSFDYPSRETDLYSSGLLDTIPDISVPAFYGAVDRGQETWLWLEDLTEIVQPEWTVDRFALIARQLGRMNGSWLDGRPLQDHPSLSRHWLAGRSEAAAHANLQLDAHREHPVVRQVVSPHQAEWLNRVWENRHQHLDFLASMPQVFSHLDAFPRNIFFRDKEGLKSTTLIDWSFAGLAAPGEELAALCIASALFSPALVPHLSLIERAAFNSYVQGLQERGWAGDEADIWRSYRNTAELRYGPAGLRTLLPFLTHDEFRAAVAADIGLSPDRLAPHLASITQWMIDSST